MTELSFCIGEHMIMGQYHTNVGTIPKIVLRNKKEYCFVENQGLTRARTSCHAVLSTVVLLAKVEDLRRRVQFVVQRVGKPVLLSEDVGPGKMFFDKDAKTERLKG
jgi:hypothetical protein